MQTYTIELSKAGRCIYLQELKEDMAIRQDMITFPDKVMQLHQIKDFFQRC